MASSVDSSSLTSPPLPSSLNSTVTQEEFNLFHSIDRDLFTRLVLGLRRDPAETMQVMALWLWLEEAGGDQFLVKKLLSLPDTLLNALADEAVVCLNCVENDKFVLLPEPVEVPLTQSLTESGVSLQFFHENRLGVLRGVTKILNDVCARAFEDILRKAIENKLHLTSNGEDGNGPAMTVVEPGSIAENVPGGFHHSIIGPVLSFPFYDPRVGVLSQQIFANFGPSDKAGIASSMVEVGANAPHFWCGLDPYDLTMQRQIVSSELCELLNRINLVTAEEEKEVPQDDRTIFLTFSKGYPISENEVTDFFTKKFGDCIDAIHMQEVSADEQVLYARLVVHSPSNIEVVLDGQSKAKFSINGKHVWARKYVRKHSKSPRGPTSPPGQPAPAAEEETKSN